MILKDSLSKSTHTVKNSWEFQNNIFTKSIPDGRVMVSLDVVSMFPNISLGLIKKAVSCFIMDSTFKLNGEFYKKSLVLQ